MAAVIVEARPTYTAQIDGDHAEVENQSDGFIYQTNLPMTICKSE